MTHPSSSSCILVVDDQAANIQTVGTLLNSVGYDVMSATSAEQALQRLAARQPDLILLDMMMPGVSGLDLCRRLKSKPEWEEIPIIFLSAAGEVPVITAALDAGAVDYVTKPFHRAELLSRLRTHLDLKAARDELRSVVADKDELLGLMAHDFKNHLAAMRMHAEFLAKNAGDLSAAAAESASTIARESTRMARSVQELLANQSALRQPLTPSVFNAAEIVADAAAAIRPLADAKSQKLTVALPPEPPMVAADAPALRQVLDNLLSNAVKFSPPGGRLGLAVSSVSGTVTVVVQDSGPGFTREDKARAFQRYARLSARPTAGEISTGLGLSIARRLTERMGGTLTFETDGGSGLVTLVLSAETGSVLC
ncbi:MAG: hybrid sensor histidine kinase/response regulator [Verrucomicrobiales bacterium]|nr:hybrid sensor histidine kinase/response regulator [Verrucomicrobiales bacterium]